MTPSQLGKLILAGIASWALIGFTIANAQVAPAPAPAPAKAKARFPQVGDAPPVRPAAPVPPAPTAAGPPPQLSVGSQGTMVLINQQAQQIAQMQQSLAQLVQRFQADNIQREAPGWHIQRTLQGQFDLEPDGPHPVAAAPAPPAAAAVAPPDPAPAK
jgi:TolA-binding protein